MKESLHVHAPKNSGTSISHVLNEVWAKAHPARSKWKQAFHVPARDLKVRCPARWEKSVTHGVLRNPWDRVRSLFTWQKQFPNVPFDFWVEAVFEHKIITPTRFKGPFLSQVDYFCDQQGEVLVDHLLRYETLDDDFEVLCRELDIELCSLPKLNVSSTVPYTEVYTEKSRAIVENYFFDDIKRWGFTFGQ